MSLKNMTLTASATIAVSGGSPLVFADDGITIQNGVHLVVPADADYQTRRQVTVKYRPPNIDAKTNVYGKDKKSIVLVKPIVLSSGQVVFNTWRLEREMHPSLTAAECAELNKLAAQLIVDTDVDAFWATGSTT